MRRILCYGDSNTWGYIPGSGQRYPADVRWTGVAQRLLGAEYLMIEEGLNGRLTVYDNPARPWQKGLDTLPAVLHSQKPLDLVIIMLGTNDLVRTDAFGVSEGMRAMVDKVYEHHKNNRPSPDLIFADQLRVLVVSPILMHDMLHEHDGERHRAAPEESRKMARLYAKVAQDMGVDFMDAALYAEPSEVDGIHMSAESHRALGEAMARKIREIFAK